MTWELSVGKQDVVMGVPGGFMGVLEVCWRRVGARGGRKSGYHGTAVEQPGLESDSSWPVPPRAVELTAPWSSFQCPACRGLHLEGCLSQILPTPWDGVGGVPSPGLCPLAGASLKMLAQGLQKNGTLDHLTQKVPNF